jgi:catechol 2,3-dioxygenase
MTSLQVHLSHLHLTSPNPAAMAAFYAARFGMAVAMQGDTGMVDPAGPVDGQVWCCTATGRRLVVSLGAANQLRYAVFEFESADGWIDWRARVADGAGAAVLPVVDAGIDPGWGVHADAVALRDPDGNLLVFEPPRDRLDGDVGTAPTGSNSPLPAAHLQHFALRTTDVQAMADFYAQVLGFVVSDRVVDEHGVLRACFLRANTLHHTLAIFGAPARCFDHQSFETPDWAALKDWADHMGRIREVIVWGVGRHGPGNDVFFMVRDPDGNLAEISSEIEICDPARPAGLWPHEEHTLNLWGKAIMRS